MRVLVTAGPTREYLDSVRFLTNASSGRMGCAVAAAAIRAGHAVTLLLGPTALTPPEGCRVVPFVTVADLRTELQRFFPDSDALVMVAAVGDFRPERVSPVKLSRSGGPITVRLIPTEDVLASVAGGKKAGQVIVAFAVEDGNPEQVEAKACREMRTKGADYVVANPPAAISAETSHACILSAGGVVLPWDDRPKEALAAEIVRLLSPKGGV